MCLTFFSLVRHVSHLFQFLAQTLVWTHKTTKETKYILCEHTKQRKKQSTLCVNTQNNERNKVHYVWTHKTTKETKYIMCEHIKQRKKQSTFCVNTQNNERNKVHYVWTHKTTKEIKYIMCEHTKQRKKQSTLCVNTQNNERNISTSGLEFGQFEGKASCPWLLKIIRGHWYLKQF